MILMKTCMYSNTLVKVWIVHYNLLFTRFDLISWDKYVNGPEILRDLHVGNNVDATIRQHIIDIIHTIGIISVREGYRDQWLTSKFSSTRVIHHRFVVSDQCTDSMTLKLWPSSQLPLMLVISLMIVKELGNPYFRLQQSLTRKVVLISTPSFGDFVSVIDLWTVLLLALDFCPTESKFDTRKDWPFSPYTIPLLSLIDFCSFYSRYFPRFDTNINPSCKLQ